MKLIIDIPEDYYKKIMDIKPSHYTAKIYLAVQKGTIISECKEEDCIHNFSNCIDKCIYKAEDYVKRSDIVQMLKDIDEAVYEGEGFHYGIWKDKLDEMPSVYPKSDKPSEIVADYCKEHGKVIVDADVWHDAEEALNRENQITDLINKLDEEGKDIFGKRG